MIICLCIKIIISILPFIYKLLILIVWGIETETIKKNFFFKDSLNGNELINYIKREIDQLGIAFMFTTDTIFFNINVKIYRSYEYMFRFLTEGRRNLNSKPY